LPLLARVYWYTVEFGLVRHGADGLRLFGAGIASSRTESVFCLDDASPHRIGFDLQRVMRTAYRIDDFQESYFVLDNLDELLHLADVDFEPLYAQVGQQAALSPDALLPSDRLWHRGNQSHRCQGRAMP
jgi:phenylalanine-4-hydroxylase